MGYYTKYSLEIEYIGNDPTAKLLEEARVLSVDIPNDYGTIGELIGNGIDCKWYDHDEDMTAISKDYPNILFTLEGDGEESVDHWKTYYKGGKKQHTKAEMRFEEFNPKKLE